MSRPTSFHAARDSSKLKHIRQVTLTGGRSDDNVFASLRATQIVASKPVLPAELLATILDYLAIPDLLRCARVSTRMKEMVYDDTRWIQKLRVIGVWNEAEARQRFEEIMKRRAEAQRAKDTHITRDPHNDRSRQNIMFARQPLSDVGGITLFDAAVEADKARHIPEHGDGRAAKRGGNLADGFDDLTISPTHKSWNSKAALTVFQRAKSIRGFARQEFGKIYTSLSPLYEDIAQVKDHWDALVFRTYPDPEQQAQALSILRQFSRCDSALGGEKRQHRLESLITIFQNAAMREFELGFRAGDIDGKLRQYAHVLATLNGGNVAVDYFISNQPVVTRERRLGDPLDCLDGVSSGHVDLNPSQAFFDQLTNVANEQASIIDRVFPPAVDVLTPLISRLVDGVINDYITALFDEAHLKCVEMYVKAVSGVYGQAVRFTISLQPTKTTPADLPDRAKEMIDTCFERHVDLYLTEELALFRSKSDDEVKQWEKALSEQEASTESFFMSKINRQAAKRDFLSSFKKVVMLPVNVFPTLNTTRPATTMPSSSLAAVDTSYSGGHPRSHTMTTSNAATPNRPGTPQSQLEAPKNELLAKAAIMNSRLEGIRSLFSIEVALNLTHLAKASIERVAVISRMSGRAGSIARSQCGSIFVALLQILGDQHVRRGFDKAVKHLGEYNPRHVRDAQEKLLRSDGAPSARVAGVEPLVTFLELVNVGDLIQQMVDVFYGQELVATKLNDKDDFLDPTVQEKKRFEQMLDERVAAGLNKGIDVLMDEVEYVCATTQTTADFNPVADKAGTNGAPAILDVGPSATAAQVIEIVGSHTDMLVGSTDKNMLDVFTQEVGLRLYAVLCKHIKRQRISVDGSIKLISDINHYSAFASTLRQKQLIPYFQALRELSQIYLVHIDPPLHIFSSGANGKRGSLLSSKPSATAAQAKELATIIADTQRYHGIFTVEEVYEFAERRADWYLVKNDVERAMYGVGCSIM